MTRKETIDDEIKILQEEKRLIIEEEERLAKAKKQYDNCIEIIGKLPHSNNEFLVQLRGFFQNADLYGGREYEAEMINDYLDKQIVGINDEIDELKDFCGWLREAKDKIAKKWTKVKK